MGLVPVCSFFMQRSKKQIMRWDADIPGQKALRTGRRLKTDLIQTNSHTKALGSQKQERISTK